MDHLDRLIECAARVKQLREQLGAVQQELRVAELELATVAAGQRVDHPRASKRSVPNGTRPKMTRPKAPPPNGTPSKSPPPNGTRPKAQPPKATPAGQATSVSGRVREQMRANPAKTYDTAALMAELKLPKKNVLLVRSLLKHFTKQQLLVRVERGQYRWKA